MNDLKLLHTFTFCDNFGWSFPEVQAEAFNAATRRAEMMGWSDVSLKPISVAPVVEGSVKKYRFEIWGLGEAIHEDESSAQPDEGASTEPYRKVSREADL